MFTARCVPNMYLFGTFSAQNPPKNRAIAAGLSASTSARWRIGGMASPFRRTGRSGVAG
jgi:hypothetical protein